VPAKPTRPRATRLRAWFLRTFAGRTAEQAGWDREPVVAAGPARRLTLGALTLDVVPVGLRAAGANPRSVVYKVTLTAEGSPPLRIGGGQPRAWSSSYGFPPAEAGALHAAEAALDELWQAHSDFDAWVAQVTAGMSEAEAEAMLDSPAVRLDAGAAAWVGPLLEPHRANREAGGTWFAPEP
jgi:hypothetical protein